MAHDDTALFEHTDHVRVGIEHVLTGPLGDLRRVTAVLVHRADRRDAGSVARVLVVLAETGRHVDHARAVLGGDEVAAQDLERARRAVGGDVGEVVEQRGVAAADSSTPVSVPTWVALASSLA